MVTSPLKARIVEPEDMTVACELPVNTFDRQRIHEGNTREIVGCFYIRHMQRLFKEAVSTVRYDKFIRDKPIFLSERMLHKDYYRRGFKRLGAGRNCLAVNCQHKVTLILTLSSERVRRLFSNVCPLGALRRTSEGRDGHSKRTQRTTPRRNSPSLPCYHNKKHKISRDTQAQ
jgi:hypothetical protein